MEGRMPMKKLPSLVLMIFFLMAATACAATYYVCDTTASCNAAGGTGWSGTPSDSGTCASKSSPCKTLKYAFTKMSGGDELVIGNGVYKGDANRIYTSSGGTQQAPPSGISKSQMTIVRADVDGQVVLDGEGTRTMFYLTGRQSGTRIPKFQKYQDIQFVRTGSDPWGAGNIIGNAQISTEVPPEDLSSSFDAFIYIKNCGFHSAASATTMQFAGVRNILMEDSYSWGKGRYGVQVYTSDDIVIRRHVDRRDVVDLDPSQIPVANYVNYAGHYVEWQNCIAIDTDSTMWETGMNPVGSFYIRKSYEYSMGFRSSTTTGMRGSMVVNFNALADGSWYNHDGGVVMEYVDSAHTIINNAIMGSTSGFSALNAPSVALPISHCSVIAANHVASNNRYAFVDGASSGKTVVTDSMAYNNALFSASSGMSSSSHHNNAYGNAANTFSGSSNTATNPLLLFPVRIEAGSPNKGTASDGGDRGATILKRYGVDGTFYGDAGYADLSDVNLWPWTNENDIKSAFLRDYGTAQGKEARGFTTGTSKDGSPQTLTRYIWEYLGSACPTDICTTNNSTPTCGDHVCNGNENCSTCSSDCGSCASVCGDQTCNGAENCTTCVTDCGQCPIQCLPAETAPCNGCINAGELSIYIAQWRSSTAITMKQLIDAIVLWKGGCPQ
jgi:hypothetical protein